MKLPVFLMGFANDRQGNYLRGIAKEQDAIKAALRERSDLCQLEVISDLTIDKLISSIREFEPQVFHYGGHASGDGLFLDASQSVKAENLAKLLTHVSGVELVFLNGCATLEQARAFREHGVRHVIVTNKLINDDAAVNFAYEFYQALSKGDTVPKAYDWAVNSIQANLKPDGSNRSAVWQDAENIDPEKFPWELMSDESEEPWQWTEPKLKAWGRVKAERKDGTGLPGVKVRRGREFSTFTNEEGYFNLEIEKSNLGKRIEIEVEKSDYRVVNQEDLRIFPEVDAQEDDELVELIMAPLARWEICRRVYHQLNLAGSIQERVDQSAQPLSEAGGQASAHIPIMVKHMQQVDLDEAEDQYVRAMQLIGRRKFKRAIEVLDNPELEAELQEIRRQEELTRQKRKRIVETLLLRASIHVMEFDFSGAEQCYRQAVSADPENHEVWEKFLDYLYKQNRHDMAREICREHLSTVNREFSKTRDHAAFFDNYLGRIQLQLNDLTAAEKSLKQAIALRHKLVKSKRELRRKLKRRLDDRVRELNAHLANPTAFERKKTEALFHRILKLRERLASIQLESAQGQLAASMNNLGKLYLRRQQVSKAEVQLKKSLDIDLRMADEDPRTFDRYVAANYNDLGLLCAREKRYDEAEAYYQKALAIHQAMAGFDPTEFSPLIAENLLNLGKLFTYQKNHEAALESYQKALDIQEKYAASNPAAYNPTLSATHHSLGRLYLQQKEFSVAKTHFEMAKAIRYKMMRENPEAYTDEYAATLTDFGRLLRYMGELDAAERTLIEARNLIDDLVKRDRDVFEHYLIVCHYELGKMYTLKQDWAAAQTALDTASELFEKWKEVTFFTGEKIMEALKDLAKLMPKKKKLSPVKRK